MTPRLVATDLDGTIVRSDGTISPRTVAALGRVERAGATLVMVTGRPPRWMGQIADEVGHHGLAICANGAVLYDLRTQAVVGTHEISTAVLTEVIDRLRAIVPEFQFAVEYPDGFVFDRRYRLGNIDAERFGGRAVEEAHLTRHSATKLLALLADGDPDSLTIKASEAVGDLVTITYSSRSSGLLEMSALGVTKASALADLCGTLDITSPEVVAFGDMPNDLPMLAWAGRPYAVANAHQDVLAACPNHTASNDEDGVAQVLEALFPASS